MRRVAVLAGAAAAALPALAAAQQPSQCTFICKPTLAFNVASHRSHVLGGPTVRTDSSGATHTVPSATNLELQFVVTAKTTIPRVSGMVSATWLPTAESRANPFTEYTANQVGEDIRANQVVLSLGALVDVLPAKSTDGLFAVDGYAADLMSPAARPDDASIYTHKLDVGALALVYPFASLDSASALHRSGAYAYVNLDYVASGLPHKGDDVPKGVQTYVTGARPAALIVGIGMPIAPLLGG